MNVKFVLLVAILLSIGVAAALTLPYYPSTLPNGDNVSNIPDPSTSFVVIDSLVNQMQNENINLNNLYFKVIVPNDDNNEWNLSQNFMERKPTAILFPIPLGRTPNGLSYWFASQPVLAFACCNITKGDLLYTANASNPDGSFNITLAGTLTNNYNQNWKSRVYNSTESAWGNVNVGKATKPDIYNRRAILESDGVVVGYAMESINVTVPTLIKIYKV